VHLICINSLRLSAGHHRAMTPAPLLALGFRPLYLLAGLYAALSVPLWALQFAGWLPGANPLWHAHEMLFGYAFAVIAGFLLTAVRVWSGKPTPTGWPLASIAAIWILSRVVALQSLQVSAWIDLAFAAAVAIGIGRPLVASGNRRNWFFIALMLLLGAASVAFTRYSRIGMFAGLDVVLFIMAVMGGRVIPAFTNSAIPGAGARRNQIVEYGALAALVVLFAFDLLEWFLPAAIVCLVAAGFHAARLALWAPLATRGRPILWILHLSYAWIVVHLVLRGLVGFDLVASGLATHALTVGAIGGLTLGMMTRTSRGHTARPLQVGGAELAAYVLVHIAAAVRVFLPLVFPNAYVTLVAASAALWFAAFALFTAVYFPILSRPRLDGQPG
jgi:uncharacterized protein involved in response to NO